MYQKEGFWDGDSSKREYCYRVIPKDVAQAPGKMTLHGFDIVYQALGELGYKFRDAGHNDMYVIVSLNKPIDPNHLKGLEEVLSIKEDNGTELAFV